MPRLQPGNCPEGIRQKAFSCRIPAKKGDQERILRGERIRQAECVCPAVICFFGETAKTFLTDGQGPRAMNVHRGESRSILPFRSSTPAEISLQLPGTSFQQSAKAFGRPGKTESAVHTVFFHVPVMTVLKRCGIPRIFEVNECFNCIKQLSLTVEFTHRTAFTLVICTAPKDLQRQRRRLIFCFHNVFPFSGRFCFALFHAAIYPCRVKAGPLFRGVCSPFQAKTADDAAAASFPRQGRVHPGPMQRFRPGSRQEAHGLPGSCKGSQPPIAPCPCRRGASRKNRMRGPLRFPDGGALSPGYIVPALKGCEKREAAGTRQGDHRKTVAFVTWAGGVRTSSALPGLPVSSSPGERPSWKRWLRECGPPVSVRPESPFSLPGGMQDGGDGGSLSRPAGESCSRCPCTGRGFLTPSAAGVGVLRMNGGFLLADRGLSS